MVLVEAVGCRGNEEKDDNGRECLDRFTSAMSFPVMCRALKRSEIITVEEKKGNLIK